MTTFPRSMLDTDILSAVMRRDPRATAKAATYISLYGRFTFSIITRYEILRGLKARRATSQLAVFERLCNMSEILPVTDEVIVKTADIYAELHARGALIPDADLLIAATALVKGCALATNNEGHFRRINGLFVENWLI